MRFFRPIFRLLCKIAYPNFKNEEYYTRHILLFIITQKVLGFNRKAQWPVHFTSKVKMPEKIQWGSKAPGSAVGCYLDGRNGITIEENVWIGPRVSIISMNHDNCNYYNYIETKPIIIRRNSLLTTNCVILPGVELGEHTVVAAGAIVTKSFPEGNQVLAGNPARVIKKLDPYQKGDVSA